METNTTTIHILYGKLIIVNFINCTSTVEDNFWIVSDIIWYSFGA